MISSYELPERKRPRNETLEVSAADIAPEGQRESLIRSDSLEGSDETETQYSTTLSRSNNILLLILVYATLALFAWVVTCILAYRPIHGHSYGVDIRDDHYGSVSQDLAYTLALYVDSERWYTAARVLQSIVSVLAIPLTSAVCSRAAVAFTQQPRLSWNLTMRQTMTLADKGWADLGLISRILRGQWKRYGSSFLAVAISLNILGAVISPLQQIFLSTKTIKTPTSKKFISYLVDMDDHWTGGVDDYVVTLTRSRLASTRITDPQARLWSGGLNCNSSQFESESNNVLCDFGGGQYTLANMSKLQDPFFTELPYGFSTGLMSQFAPRINSSAKREIIDDADFPSDCSQITDALYINYSNATTIASENRNISWSVEVCMPGNMSAAAWVPSHGREDFSEELYLRINFQNFDTAVGFGYRTGVYSSKITLNTTAGYFELPNYANDEAPGPLLEGDVTSYCGLSCPQQRPNIYDRNITSRDVNSGTAVNATLGGLSNSRKGPLQTLALSLFGLGSFLDTIQETATYIEAKYNLVLEEKQACIAAVPFLPLTKTMVDIDTTVDSQNTPYLDPCLVFYTRSNLEYGAAFLGAQYLWMFLYNDNDDNNSVEYDPSEDHDGVRIANAFTSAAFIANGVWMVDNPDIPSGTLKVSYDMGTDTQRPSISLAGIIVVSVLLGLDLLCLVVLAVYSTRVPRWTEQLDSLAMMRLGAAMADQLPLRVAKKSERIEILDRVPGGIGDATGGEGTVGDLGIGAKTPLRRRRKYHCYKGDHETEKKANY